MRTMLAPEHWVPLPNVQSRGIAQVDKAMSETSQKRVCMRDRILEKHARTRAPGDTMLSDADVVTCMCFVAVMIAVVELVCSGSVANAMLRTQQWVQGRVYLYTMHEPATWGFVPDVRCLAVKTLLRLLKVEFEVKVITRGDDCPSIEMDGQRFSEFHQIVNALSLMHGYERRAETFWVNPESTDYSTAAVTRMILTSTAPLVERWQWDNDENAAVMLEANADNKPGMLPMMYSQRRLRLEHSRQRGAYDPATTEEFTATVHRDLNTIEKWLKCHLVKNSFIDGGMPGPHDCIVYAALKVVLDSPLPTALAPEGMLPNSRRYLTRFEERVQARDTRDTASPRRL